jgi:hypothetical protein
VSGFGLLLTAAPAFAQETEDVVTYHSQRTAYRVAGWEQGLVRTSPNLGQFYWDPQTRYMQKNGSRRTGKGVNIPSAPTSIYRSHSSMRCKTAPLHRAQFSAEQMAARTAVSANVRFNHAKGQLASTGRGSSDQDCFGVLSYGNNGDSAYDQAAGGGSRSQKLSVKAQIYGKGKN